MTQRCNLHNNSGFQKWRLSTNLIKIELPKQYLLQKRNGATKYSTIIIMKGESCHWQGVSTKVN